MTLETVPVSLLESPIEELGASTAAFIRWMGCKQRQICSLAITTLKPEKRKKRKEN